MTTIKAIETRYAGCRFRSRLEARWAVFFDALGVEWQYEPEGFETPAGRYLPDFYFPEHGRWIEIKGGAPTKRDLERGALFAEAKWQAGEGYRFLIGDIPRRIDDAWPPGIPALTYTQVQRVVFSSEDGHVPPQAFVKPGTYLEWPAETRGWLPSRWRPYSSSPDQVNAALAAARSARFEHGETPAPPS